MAILYSYPQASPGLNDLVLGSQYVEGEGMVAKSFTLSDIGQLFNNTYPGGSSYTSFVARLTQNGTDANSVVMEVLHNDTGWTFTAVRTDVGVYTITVSGDLSTFDNSVYYLTDVNLDVNANFFSNIKQISSNVIRIRTYKATASDNYLSESPLEIKFF